MPVDINGTYLLGAQMIVGLKINSNDPSLRDAILNYTSGQQVNNITNLTQQAINNAQQATQQGGSSGGGGGNSTSQGVIVVGGDQNLQERLAYLDKATKEQAANNYQGLLKYFNTDPVPQSIINEGVNSPYLEGISPEAAESIVNSYKQSYELVKKLKTLNSPDEYRIEALRLKNSRSDTISKVFDGTALADLLIPGKSSSELRKILTGLNNTVGKILVLPQFIHSLIDVWVKTELLVILKDDFESKYPDVDFDSSIEIAELKLPDGTTRPMRIVNPNVRSRDPKLVDEINVLQTELNYAKRAVFFNIAGSLLKVLEAIPRINNAASNLNSVVSKYTLLSESQKKATAINDYFNGVNMSEESWWETYGEEFFNQDYSVLKNSLKNENAVEDNEPKTFNDDSGNNTLLNVQNNYSISAKNGNKKIVNVGDKTKIDVGSNKNDNEIINLGNDTEIKSDNDNNNISNTGSNVRMNLNDGINNVINAGNTVTVNTTSNEKTYVGNIGRFVVIQLGNGANDVENFGSNVTVNTGNKADLIINYGDITTVNSGNDSDTVINNGTKSLINLEAGNDYVYNDSLGSGTTIAGGDGNDTLENRASSVSINGGSGNNRIVNDGVAVTMISGDGADTIANAGNAALINSGNGNNSIGNAGDNSSIFAGNGTDSILNEGNNTAINIAGGSNQITNKGSATSIVIGSGNNTIQNYGEATNIKSGTGSDFIMNGAIETTIDSGNGTDTVVNYFAMQADDNGNFTKVLFNGNNVLINGGADSDIIENYGSFGTIKGGAGNDTIRNFGVLLIDQNGNIIRTAQVTNYYYHIDAGDGNNLVYNENDAATITSGTGADLIENIADTVNINAGDGANTIANAGNTVTIQSGSGNDSIESEGSNVIISAGAGNDFIRNYSNGSNTTIYAGAGNDTIVLDAGVQNTVIRYNLGEGNLLIKGFNVTSTLSIAGDFSSIKSGSDIIVKTNDGNIKLEGVAGISGLHIVRDNSTPTWTLSGTTATYGMWNNILVTVSGVKSLDGLAIDTTNKKVTVSASSLGNDKVTINNGYTLKLGSNVTQSTTTTAGWSLNSSTATYKAAYSSAGYKLDNNQISYVNASGGNTLVTVSGVKSLNGLVIDTTNKKVTVSASSLGTDKVTVNNGYTLKLGSNVTQSTTTAAGWSLNGSTATYKSASTSVGYKLNNNQISYVNASGGNTLVTVSGIKSLNGLAIDTTNKKVTVSASSLGTDKVTVSNGYTLKLGNDVTQSSTTPAGWSLNGSTATYKSALTSAGYKLNNNQISYVNASGGNTLVTVSGVKSLNGLAIDTTNKKVTVSASSVGTESITLSGDAYTLLITLNENADTYSNNQRNATIAGLGGNDSIYNNYENVSINAGTDNDTVQNSWSGSNVTITGGTGDDFITNYGSNVTLTGGADNDSIYNRGDKVIIDGGTGHDSIENRYGAGVSIDGGAGNDTIYSYGDNASIKSGEGSDSIYNYQGNNTTIDSGNSDDTINNFYGSNVSINAGSGDNYLYNFNGRSVNITTGDGNNSIYSSGENITIKSGEGFDTINNSGNKALIEADGGDDTVRNYGASSIIDGGIGNDSISNNVSTEPNGTFISSPDNVSINAGEGNDTVSNGGDHVLINGDAGNDSIYNKVSADTFKEFIDSPDNVTINAGAGSDTITNEGDNVLIKGDAGDDFISNNVREGLLIGSIIAKPENVTIKAGDGNDTITNYGASSVIDGGDGNDSIVNKIMTSGWNDETVASSDNVTIDGGAGDDTIDNEGNNVLFIYTGGNDLIKGFKENSTLRIGDGTDTYSSRIDGLDRIIIVGNDELTILGGATLTTFNIEGTADSGDSAIINIQNTVNNTLVTATKYNDSIYNGGSFVTIHALHGNDSVENSGSNIIINGGANNDTIYNGHVIYDEIVHFDGSSQWMVYSLGGKNISVNGDDGNDYIENNPYVWDEETQTYKHDAVANYSTLNGGAGNDTIYNRSSFVTINGGEGHDSIENYSSNVIIDGGYGDDYILTQSIKGSINGGEGDDTIYSGGDNASINGGAGNDFISNGGRYLSIRGGDGDDTISNGSWKGDAGSFVTIDAGTGNNVITNSASNVLIKAYTGNDFISNGYNESVTIDAGTGADTISNSGKSTSINSGAGDDSISAYSSEKITIDAGDGNDTIIIGSVLNYDDREPSYYNLVSNSTINGGKGNDYIENRGGENITFIHDRDGGNDTITGFNETNTLQIKNGTYSKETVDNDVVIEVHGDSSTDSITLKDAKNKNINIDGEERIFWKIDNNVATYGTSTKTLITISGVKSLEGISLKDNVVTISKVALGSEPVSISGGYTLALDNDVTQSTTTTASWSLNGTTATYKAASMSAGYKLSNNKISYVEASGGETLFTLSGIKTTDGIIVDDSNRTVMLKSSNLNEQTVTISDGYTLTLSGVSAPVTTAAHFDGLTYKSESNTAGYTLADNKITYTAAKLETDLFTLSGVKNSTSISVDGTKVIFTDTALANRTSETISISGDDYQLALSADSIVKTRQEAVKSTATLTTNDDNHVYKSTAYGEWYNVTDSAITYHVPIDAKTFKISGLSSAAKLGTNVIVTDGDTTAFKFKAAALDKKNVSITGGKFSVALDVDVDTVAETISESKALTNGTFIYTAAGVGEFYSATATGINYSAAKIGDTFTLTGIKSADGITVSGNKVTVNESALDMTATTAYAVKLTGDKFTLNFNGNTSSTQNLATLKNGVYTSEQTPAHFTGNDKEFTFMPTTTPTTFKINGLSDGAKLGNNVFVETGKVKIHAGALDTNHGKILLDTTDYSIEFGDDVATVKTINFAQNGNKVTLGGTTVGYKSDGKGGFEWQEQSGGETLTITGLKNGATLTEDMFTRTNGKITFKPTDAVIPDNPATITISDGVIDTSALTTTKATDAYWNGNTYVSAKTGSSWTTGSSTVKFTAATDGVNQFTISGLKSGVDVTKLTPDVNGNIQLTKELLPDTTTTNLKLENIVTGSNYKFVLPSGTKFSTKGETVPATFTGKSGTYNYTSAYDKEYYSGSDTAITYHEATTTTKFTISGLKTGLTLGKEVKVNDETGTVTLAVEAVGTSNIALTSDSYKKLTLPATLTTKTSHAATFTNNGTTFTYKGAYTDAYFSGGGTSYTYNKSTESSATTFTVTNLKSTSDKSELLKAFNAKKKTLTLTRAYLNGADVTISDGYKLAVDKNSAPKQTKAAGFDGTTYKKAMMSDGYTAAGNKITYVKPSGGDKVFTLTNATITNAIKADTDKKTVTLTAANLNKKDVTVDGSYTLALADDVAQKSTKTAGAFSKVSKGTATYKTNAYSDFYTLKNNKISYTSAKLAKELKISGLKSTATLSTVKKAITVTENSSGTCKITFNSADVLTTKAPTITAPKGLTYTVAVADKLSKSTTTTAWTVSGTSASLQTTASATYTVKNNKIVYTAKKITTQAELTGLAKNVKAASIGLPAKKVLTLDSAVLGTKTSLKSNSGDCSIKLTGNMKGKTFVGTSGADKLNIAATNAKVSAGGGNDSLVGGKGNDTLSGDSGNDTLTGGAGNDVFIYTAGKDTITDYATGDKISIGAAISKSTVSGTNAVFTIGSGTLTVTKGKGKEIAFVDAKGKSRTIIGGAQIFTDNSSAKVTLSSGVEVGDVSERTKAINLTGNALNNTILGGTKNDLLYGGKGNDSLIGNAGNDKLYGQAGSDTLLGGAGNDSLWGGAGNDSLYGGSGNDTFIYKPGEGTDKIFDYTSGDILTILKTNGKSGGSFTSSKYSGGDLTLSISGGGTVIFDSVAKGDKFNINGKTYTLGASKLK